MILHAVYGDAGTVKKFFARLPKKFVSKASGPNYDLTSSAQTEEQTVPHYLENENTSKMLRMPDGAHIIEVSVPLQ